MSRPLSRSALEANAWRKKMANNPKATLGRSELGRIPERAKVRATGALRWFLLIGTPGTYRTIVRGSGYATEEQARAAEKVRKVPDGGFMHVEFHGTALEHARTKDKNTRPMRGAR